MARVMPERVLEVATFAGSLDGAEVEDLLPTDLLVQQVDRWQRGPDEAFADFHQPIGSAGPTLAWTSGRAAPVGEAAAPGLERYVVLQGLTADQPRRALAGCSWRTVTP